MMMQTSKYLSNHQSWFFSLVLYHKHGCNFMNTCNPHTHMTLVGQQSPFSAKNESGQKI